MDLSYFQQSDFLSALKTLFNKLDVPINYLADEPVDTKDILSDTYKDNNSFKLINEVYFLGIVDDAAFDGYSSLAPEKIKSDYDGLLIFGVSLHQRDNNLLPTRSQLAEISRAFNRQFFYTPVVVVFHYKDNNIDYLALANTERLKYKQEWREGEKAGKVTLLRDINLNQTHAGHLRILKELRIPRTGNKKVNTFASLYQYWQNIFSVSLLNKKFYEELSNWYFWAIKQVRFPLESDLGADRNQEERATHVIRLLTRFLFVWFIKEKQLIPEELFNQDYIANELLTDFNPYNKDDFLHSPDVNSHYYKAILQNLFFATLNQEMGKRAFRRNRQNMNVTNLLRYQSLFKNPEKFIQLVENIVPFMNGGLFECLDRPHPTQKGRQGGDIIIYEDGFSDRPDNKLIVPDYLFFGADDTIDLSTEYGSKAKKYKQAAVKGLIKIFESYKFTIAENTPIEEDVALDPELLGKVFENLLASYNPETKTTARKQTGSFYTPREIVNYMVDESLIAYLKTALSDWQASDKKKEEQLHQLFSFDNINPFKDDHNLQQQIIKALDHCTILDPACGSGAFPMGILQKMVHILQKLDPYNKHWKALQLKKAQEESAQAFQQISDKKEREKQLELINNAFDKHINDPDYARKLFLIENCIYGVDIQPIAVQISKLRFFISLVVEQKVDKTKDNFGIRPLPNLETKFVAANTLIGIKKPAQQGESLAFSNPDLQNLEQQLKTTRHKLFSAKTPKTKRNLRKEDQELRQQMGQLLINDGWGSQTAEQLATWDPYNQNASSDFFDPEWMFGIQEGFDVVIGNPPYMRIQGIRKDSPSFADYLTKTYSSATGSYDLYIIFTEKGLSLIKENGILNYIMPVKWTNAAFGKGIRELFVSTNNKVTKIISFGAYQVFNASTYTGIQWFGKDKKQLAYLDLDRDLPDNKELTNYLHALNTASFNYLSSDSFSNDAWVLTSATIFKILNKIELHENRAKDVFQRIFTGLQTSNDSVYFLHNCRKEGNNITGFSKELDREVTVERDLLKPLLKGDQVHRYDTLSTDKFVVFPYVILDGKAILYSEEELKVKFPLGYDYLKENEGVLRGREKGRFNTDGEWFQFGRKQGMLFGGVSKLISPDISLGGNFSYDKKGRYYSSTTLYGYIKKDSSGYSYRQLLAIMNSSICWYYLINTGTVLANNYFRFKPDYINKLPIPSIKENIGEILNTLVEAIMYSKSKNDSHHIMFTLQEVVDALICNLYFPKHMQEKQIDVASFVEADLEQTLQNRNFESLTDIDKESIVEQLQTKWTHPNNEVRNRIKLFAVRSPDILKPILESQP